MSPTRPLRILSACVLLSALGTTSIAAAQSSHTEESAQARFNAGLKYYDRGEYDRAREEFLQAQAIFPKPALLRNLALTEVRTGRPLDALQHLRAYLADPGTTPDKRALAEQNLAEAYAMTGHLSITAPRGTRLKVDGKEIGVAPLKDAVDVAAGPHGVDAEMSGAALHEAVTVGAGMLSEVAFVQPVLAETKVVMAAPTTAPATTPPPPRPALREPYWNGRRTAGVVIAGVGAVGMVVGGVFGAERAGNTSDAGTAATKAGPGNSVCYSAASPACSSLSSALNSNGTHATLETTFFVAGGALLVGGVVTTLWPSASRPSVSALVPSVGPGGLQWNGSF
jgi:hypothetical protein